MTVERLSGLDGDTDRDLLRRYIQQKSEAAFAQIIRRHYALVYATCKREVGDAELAQDVAQVVFLLLARKAPVLRGGTGLAGWLFQTARFAAKNALRQERRRQQREAKEQVVAQHQSAAGFHPLPSPWEGIEPHLNDALSQLKPADREAVLLRFVEGHSLAEVGARLGLSENTARMRVTRAVERMRRHLAHLGVTISAALLAGLLMEKARAAAVTALTAPVNSQVNNLLQGAVKAMRIRTATTLAATIAATALVTFPLIAASTPRGARRSSASIGNPSAEPHQSPCASPEDAPPTLRSARANTPIIVSLSQKTRPSWSWTSGEPTASGTPRERTPLRPPPSGVRCPTLMGTDSRSTPAPSAAVHSASGLRRWSPVQSAVRASTRQRP